MIHQIIQLILLMKNTYLKKFQVNKIIELQGLHQKTILQEKFILV